MPKQKKNLLLRLHKIKLHKNRWLIWTVGFLLVVFIALMGVIKLDEEYYENQTINYSSAAKDPLVYKDQTLKFLLRYPATWSIEAQDDTVIFDAPGYSEALSVSVANYSAETALRKTLNIQSEGRTILDGTSAAKIANLTKQGTIETIVLVHHNRRLYIVRSTAKSIDSILATFKFLPLNNE